MDNDYAECAKVFKALCDQTRLRIIDMLGSGERCGCNLLDGLDIGQPSLSYHMKILVESGIVESRQVGKWTRYRLSRSGFERAEALLKAMAPSGSQAPSEDDGCG